MIKFIQSIPETQVNMNLQKSIFLFLFISLAGAVQARHIIGGYATYNHISGTSYQVKMEMYRDCNGGGAIFDDIAFVGVFYRPNPSTSYGLVQQLSPRLSFVDDVNLNREPCIDYPADTCVEFGIYEFNVNLPERTGDYVVSYQRCCRNNGVVNIVYPQCGVGSTFFVEITQKARELRNNGPEFVEFPPVVICSDFRFEYDHSAIDEDGDLFTYEFCAPKSGGGFGGSNEGFNCGGANDPTGVRPNPPTTPPYQDVDFEAAFSATQPIPGNPPLRINSASGEITGFPDVNGLYAVGVCINEFRDGELIGRYIRDFQFYITDCEATVEAGVRGAIIDANGDLVIRQCGERRVFLDNTSSERSNIFTHRWTTEINNEVFEYDDWDLTLEYPDYGTYPVTLLLNEGEVCADTVGIRLDLLPGVFADFETEVDSCRISPVAFRSTSQSEADYNLTHQWDFGEGTSGQSEQINHLFSEPGNYEVSLTVSDRNNCQDTRVKQVAYYPTPVDVAVSPNIIRGCVPQRVFFDNLTHLVNEDYQIIWNFGDGNIDTALSPYHTYEVPGTYSVSVDITSPIGCNISRTFTRLLTVNPSPVADFNYSPKTLDRFQREVRFENLSRNYSSLRWDFGRGETIYRENPVFSFADTGLYVVSLIATNEFNCLDTAQVLIDIYPSIRHFLPNAFTPNQDGSNDTYGAQGVFGGIQDYHLQVFDRYGQKIFESNSPLRQWDGINQNNGKQAPSGSYLVRVKFLDGRGKRYEDKSLVTLYR